MKKLTLFIILAASLGGSLLAQDTLWQKPAPLGNYFYNNWIDTTAVYSANPTCPNFAHIIASRFVAKGETMEVYGIAAMMVNYESLTFHPSSAYPDLQSYFAWKYPDNPSLENCEESLLLYQYQGSPIPNMQQLGDTLPIHILNTPVSYWVMSNTPPVSSMDTFPKPVYERYFSTPQTVHDTFYVGFTYTSGRYYEIDSSWHDFRPWFCCLAFRLPGQSLGYDEDIAAYRQVEMDAPCEWNFLHNQLRRSYFIFPILTPPDTTPHPDTTVNPNDTLVPADTLTTGYYVLHSGNTVVIAPGDTLVISGDTLVNTGDTLVVTLGDTVVIGGSTLVLDAGDTLFVNPGDTLFVGPDGSIHVNPGGTIVVNSGSGDDPGAGLRQTDMVSRYTSVAPNPATERATVLSSFGLERIEVYDSQGRLLHTLPAAGYRATLDLSAWPRGTYLLRIHTPLGTTTKKLLVQ